MKYISTLLFACLSTYMIAQTPLNASDFINAYGEAFTLDYISSPADTSGYGMNQTWNYADLEGEMPLNIFITDGDIALGSEDFPLSNNIWDINEGNTFQFFYLGDSYSFMGQTGQSMSVIYSDPQDYLHFPTTLYQTFTDSFAAEYSIQAIQGDLSGNTQAKVDGFGTLILPWGEIDNVYRVKYDISQTEIFTTQDQTIHTTSVGYAYCWFAPGYPSFLLSTTNIQVTIEGTGQTQIQSSTQYLTYQPSAIFDATQADFELEVVPNPASEKLNIHLGGVPEGSAMFTIFDLQGRPLFSYSTTIAGSTPIRSIDVSSLSAGMYLLNVRAAGRSGSIRFAVR